MRQVASRVCVDVETQGLMSDGGDRTATGRSLVQSFGPFKVNAPLSVSLMEEFALVWLAGKKATAI